MSAVVVLKSQICRSLTHILFLNLFFFSYKSTLKVCHNFIKGRGLSTRTSPLAASSKRSNNFTSASPKTATPTKQQHNMKELVLSYTTKRHLDRRRTPPKNQQLQMDTPRRRTIQRRKMVELGRPREGIVLDSSTMACIAPLKNNLGQRRAPDEGSLESPGCVSKCDAPNRVMTTSRTMPSSCRSNSIPKLLPGDIDQTGEVAREVSTHLGDASKEGNDTHGHHHRRH
jgi:hypothetical protein